MRRQHLTGLSRYPYRRMLLGSLKPTCPDGASQERQKWQPQQDFCEDARRCYGIDKRFQRRLRKEAESRTQGRDEPVRDYIIFLRGHRLHSTHSDSTQQLFSTRAYSIQFFSTLTYSTQSFRWKILKVHTLHNFSLHGHTLHILIRGNF